MSAINLGRLHSVDLREAWASESSDFTPWLAQEENLKLLGETIGIELELESQETEVGPFRADILCKDTATDNWVLIENQLERTDHSHLGQLLTYAAGLNAVTIVWIAQRFTEEHRAALDWLNEHTDGNINLLGWKSSYGGSALLQSLPSSTLSASLTIGHVRSNKLPLEGRGFRAQTASTPFLDGVQKLHGV